MIQNKITWSAIEVIFTKIIQFLITIILARLLSPEDFGLIAIIMIFVSLAQVLVDGGLSSALIRKKSVTKKEISTAFFFNLVLSLTIYGVIYLIAPIISEYYQDERITLAIRVLSINILIGVFCIIPRAIFTIDMNYKSLGKSSIISSMFSGIIAIVLAKEGFQHWSLIIQVLLMTLLNSIFLNIQCTDRIKIYFNKKIAKELFDFGYKILLSGLLDIFFKNIYIMLLGKFSSATNVGYFSQSDRLCSLPIISLTQIIQRVNFQIMVRNLDDRTELTKICVNAYKLFAIFFIPICLFNSFFSRLIIDLLLGEKWSGISLIFGIMILSYAFLPLGSICLNLLKVVGRSDIYLKIEIYKKGIVLITALLSLPFGLNGLVISMLISSFINLFINLFSIRKFIDISICDLFYFKFLISVISIVIIFAVVIIGDGYADGFMKLVLSLLFCLVAYCVILTLFMKDTVKQVLKGYHN